MVTQFVFVADLSFAHVSTLKIFFTSLGLNLTPVIASYTMQIYGLYASIQPRLSFTGKCMLLFCYSAFRIITIYNIICTKKVIALPWLLINKVYR